MRFLVAAWAWLLAHKVQLMLTGSLVLLALRAVPQAHWQGLETDWPRVANLARALRAALPDLFKLARALLAIWTGRPWDLPPPSDPPSRETMPPKPIEPKGASMRFALFALVLAGCSASEVRRQAVAADTIARAANAGLDVLTGPQGATKISGLYETQQLDAARAACGNTRPCADPEAARDAVLAVRARWAPVWSAWALASVAHSAWASQLRRCQEQSDDAGTACTVDLAALGGSVLAKVSTLRCAMRGLGVADPFPGTVTCGDEK